MKLLLSFCLAQLRVFVLALPIFLLKNVSDFDRLEDIDIEDWTT